MNKILFVLAFLGLFLLPESATSQDLMTFESLEQERRYQVLITELRCPKCLNQSIADSDAGISDDLRNLVYEQIRAGKTDAEIKAFLQQRYGEFILYKPSKDGFNLILWVGPVIAMIITLIWLLLWIKRRGSSSDTELPLSEAEQAQVKALLKSNMHDGEDNRVTTNKE